MPAAIFVMTEKPSSSIPQCAAVSASVTVDMPTASPPSSRMARISAGVSNCGPGMKKYTPSWTRSFVSLDSCKATSRRRGVYIRLTSKKRSPNSGRFFPRMGLAPLSFMWSEMTMISPGR